MFLISSFNCFSRSNAVSYNMAGYNPVKIHSKQSKSDKRHNNIILFNQSNL